MDNSLEFGSGSRLKVAKQYLREVVTMYRRNLPGKDLAKTRHAINDLADRLGVSIYRIKSILYGQLDCCVSLAEFRRFEREYADYLDSEIVAALDYARELRAKRACLPLELSECSDWSALTYGSPAVTLALRSVAQL